MTYLINGARSWDAELRRSGLCGGSGGEQERPTDRAGEKWPGKEEITCKCRKRQGRWSSGLAGLGERNLPVLQKAR